MVDLIANFVDNIVKYADNAGLDRDALIAKIAEFLYMTSATCTFKDYECKED